MARRSIHKDDKVVIESKVTVIGKDEEGFERTGDTLFVQLEDVSGRRFNHNARFDTSVMTILGLEDVKGSAERSVEILKHRVLSRGYIDDSCWEETLPKYGSPRYQVVNGLR
jgi:hypothetical protein